MDEKESWAQQFEKNRGHLRAVAYRVLGSLNEADDAVQEAWLRLSRSDATAIENLEGWLTTVVARVCLDILRSRASRREETLEAQKFEPPAKRQGASDPEQEVLLADSVGLALLVVLDRLTPAERIAFVLHDMFAVSFDESPLSLAAPQLRRGNWQAGPAAVCRERTGFPPPIFPNNEKSSALSLPLCVPVISRASSPFSIRMSWCALTALPCLRARQQKSAVPGLGPRARSPSRSLCVPHHRCWSTARWDSYGPQVAGCRECFASRLRAGRSSKSR
jgi:RNA polymerase sigma factor (sigma-70 family)